jgi:hypothetical protein
MKPYYYAANLKGKPCGHRHRTLFAAATCLSKLARWGSDNIHEAWGKLFYIGYKGERVELDP